MGYIVLFLCTENLSTAECDSMLPFGRIVKAGDIIAAQIDQMLGALIVANESDTLARLYAMIVESLQPLMIDELRRQCVDGIWHWHVAVPR
jgi:hypothetical protein